MSKIINKIRTLELFRFKRSRFIKNASVLISGSFISQAIAIITAPIVTRLYSPGDYGLLGIYMMASTIIGVMSTLQYHTAIVVEKDNLIADNLVWICFKICFIVSCIFVIPVIFLNAQICSLLGDNDLSIWLYFMPVTILFTGFNNTLLCWANRQAMFKAMAFNRMLAAIVTPIFSISIGYFIAGPLGLFIGLIISQALPAIFLGRKFLHLNKSGFSLVSKRTRIILKKHNAFLKFNMPGELINTFVNQLPVFVLGKYFSTGMVGQYNLGNRLLSMPSQIISQSVGEVFRQKASEDYNAIGNCKRIFLKTALSLGAISLLPFLILILWSPELFAFFFGEKWILAGKFVTIMSVMYLLRFIVSPLTFVCFIVRKNYVSLLGTIYYAISSIVLSIILVKKEASVFTLLWSYVINFASVYLVMFMLNYKFSKGSK